MIDTSVKKKNHHIGAQQTVSICVDTYTPNLLKAFMFKPHLFGQILGK